MRIVLLFLLCLIPRAVLAFRLAVPCDDAYFYMHAADALDRGKVDQSLEYLNINIYPVLLMLLHRTGLDWITAGKLWGVLIGSLAVVPMYDWVRRMFDARKAALACFLYAVHPKIIEFSIEPLREATFWFLFVLCLDLIWRCVEDRRGWQFVAAGSALALVVHTRIEGWLLLAPLAVWTVVRCVRIPSARFRLLLGVVVCLAITPLFIVLVNSTLLAHHARWELGRMNPLRPSSGWMDAPPAAAQPPDARAKTARTTPPSGSKLDEKSPLVRAGSNGATAREGGPRPTIVTAVTEPRPAAAYQPAATVGDSAAAARRAAKDAERAGSFWSVRKYFSELTKSIGPVFLILSIWGFAALRQQLFDPDRAVLALLTLAVLSAIFARLAVVGSVDDRYFLLLVCIDVPFAAAACEALTDRTRRWVHARWVPGQRREWASAAALSCFLIAGWAQALRGGHVHRDAHARVGEWIRQRAGECRSVVADFDSMRAAYVAGRTMPDVVTYDEFLGAYYDRCPPDLLIVTRSSFRSDLWPHFLERVADLGLTSLDDPEMSAECRRFAVFIRRTRTASRLAADGQSTTMIR